jgi:NifU-like protein
MNGTYSENTDSILSECRFARKLETSDAEGVDANMTCGSWVRFALRIEEGIISTVGFTSNGCGPMIAAAEELSRYVDGVALSEFSGLDARISDVEALAERRPCAEAAVSALRKALAAYRENVLAASGDKALACTCFGVTIDTIETCVRNGAVTTEAVTAACRAGGGCGSCRMLIQEVIDHEFSMFTNE